MAPEWQVPGRCPVRPITALPTLKLVSMLPGATGVLREKIQEVLRTRIVPMPCIQVGR